MKQRTLGPTRIYAWLLLLAFLTPLLALGTSLSLQNDGMLPVCCRSHGKHPCSGEMFQPVEHAQPGINQIPDRCPYQALTPSFHAPAAEDWRDGSLVSVERSAVALLPPWRFLPGRDLQKRPHPKRGPPSFSDFSREA